MHESFLGRQEFDPAPMRSDSSVHASTATGIWLPETDVSDIGDVLETLFQLHKSIRRSNDLKLLQVTTRTKLPLQSFLEWLDTPNLGGLRLPSGYSRKQHRRESGRGRGY